jgi:hypothetical protein
MRFPLSLAYAPDGQGGGAAQPDGQAPAGDPNAPQAITIEGKQYRPEEVAEWRAGYLRQQDYTKKTMALAEERKAVDAIRPYLPVVEALQADPQLSQTVAAAMQAYATGQPATQAQVQGVGQAAQRAADSGNSELAVELEGLKLQLTLDKLGVKYGAAFGEHTQEIIDYGIEHGITDPEAAFKAWDYDKQPDRVKAQYVAAADKRAGKPTVPGSGGAAIYPSGNAPKTLKEANASALARLRGEAAQR